MSMREAGHSSRRRPRRARWPPGFGSPAGPARQTRPCANRLHAVGHGPYSVGAGITQAPNCTPLAGPGQRPGGPGSRARAVAPIEYVATDDRSEIETAVRFDEKLLADDRVDLILPPWGIGHELRGGPRRQQARLPE